VMVRAFSLRSATQTRSSQLVEIGQNAAAVHQMPSTTKTYFRKKQAHHGRRLSITVTR
jgi:hypothetical protein